MMAKEGTKKAPTAVTRSELSWDLLPAQLANNMWNRSAAIAKRERKPLRSAPEPLRYRYKVCYPETTSPDLAMGKHTRYN